MPGGDGTGPLGQGPVAGRGRGLGRGRGGRPGVGPVGSCVCPSCKLCFPHKAGIPCTSTKCPKCGARMVRG